MIFAGIDSGSRTVKAVLFDGDNNRIIDQSIDYQSVDQYQKAKDIYHRLLLKNGLSETDVVRIIATGYGRNIISFADSRVTEITCHATGVNYFVPDVKTVIDIGGQDSKVIEIREGRVFDFYMNDRCAAGTGKFLEMASEKLNLPLEKSGKAVEQSKESILISSMCVVFAETEIIGLLAEGKEPPDIMAGVQRSIAQRISVMGGRDLQEPIIFTGGVSLVGGMREFLSETLKKEVRVCEKPQYTGAIGACLLAKSQTEKENQGIKL